MKSWTVNFAIDRRSNEPLFLQLARAIAADVRRGRLPPGSLLPGSRSLAGALDVHRNTALAAYRELEAEGWIESSPRRGVFVSNSLPDPKPKRFARVSPRQKASSNEMPIDLRPGPAPRDWTPDPKGSLVMGGGIPDVTLAPIELVSRAYRRVLRLNARSVLSYGDPRGHANLRSELARMLAATRGLAIGADDIVVTRGSQMALDLVAQSLIGPGDLVAVESFGYGPAWEAFRRAGASLVGAPVDEEGLVVSELEKLLTRTRIRAIYVTPHDSRHDCGPPARLTGTRKKTSFHDYRRRLSPRVPLRRPARASTGQCGRGRRSVYRQLVEGPCAGLAARVPGGAEAAAAARYHASHVYRSAGRSCGGVRDCRAVPRWRRATSHSPRQKNLSGPPRSAGRGVVAAIRRHYFVQDAGRRYGDLDQS